MANVNNYIAAGRASVKKNLIARKALSDNKTDFGALGQEAIKAERDKKIAVIRSNAKVANASADAMTQVKGAEIIVDRDKSIANSKRSKRKAGMLAAGVQALGMANYLNKKTDAPNEQLGLLGQQISTYDKRIADLKTKQTELESGLANPSKPTDSSSDTATDATKATGTGQQPSSSPKSSNSSSSPGFEEIRVMAEKSGAKHPELVAAQWALESGWGKSPSGTNNYFGIKATSGESSTSKGTWEVINGQEVNTTANFKNYDSPQGSVDDLVNKWHKNFKGYTGVNSAGSASDAAGMLVTENYATDPAYADKLRKIMADQGY